MTKHHPAPWVIDPDISTVEVFTEQGDEGGFGCSWLACSGPGPRETLEANAARIVACVNALDGIEDPEAEIALLRAIKAGAVALVRAVFENGDSVPLAQDLAGLISEDMAEDLLTGLI